MAETQKARRTHCYVMRPAAYELAGCSCGNVDPDWSEFEGHLWCPVCGTDFIPASNGIFDGPVPVNGMKLMGIDIRRYCLATGKLEDLPE